MDDHAESPACLPRTRGSGSRKRKTVNYCEDNDDSQTVTQQSPMTPRKSKKSKVSLEVVDLTQDSPAKTPKSRRKHIADAPAPEKRLKQFRDHAPQSYLKVKERALTQRLTVLSRERCGTDDAPEEVVRVAGSTGNVYTIRIKISPSCNCPHALKGNQCKHIVYVMLRVLKAREDIAYQMALLSSELREVIKNAPPIPGIETDGKDGTEVHGEDTNRKPIEGECPICYDELGDERTVYCKTSCGNNIHEDCMNKWVAMSRGKATCPYCRAKWPEDTGLEGKLGSVDTSGLERNAEGYVNVAGQLGLSGRRDTSTYHSYWVRGQRRRRGQWGDDYDEDEYF